MGAKQSKRSVDISGKEAESAGEVAAAGAGGEGRVEQLADADALKPQLNGDAHIHEKSENEKELDSGTPENEKDATTEKEAKASEEEKDREPVANGEPEQKADNGDTAPTPEEGKKPKKEKVKKKFSLRSISFSRKDKPKQEKKRKDEEPKTNGEPEKVPEETAEATTPAVVVNDVPEDKTEIETKEKTPETPVTEPITNGSSTPESLKVESENSIKASLENDKPEPKPDQEPEKLDLNGLSLEEHKIETSDVENKIAEIVEIKNEEQAVEKTPEIAPSPENPVKEVCVDQMPLIEPTPPPLPANPPPSSVASFAATTMAPELADASLPNTAENAMPESPLTPPLKSDEVHVEPSILPINTDILTDLTTKEPTENDVVPMQIDKPEEVLDNIHSAEVLDSIPSVEVLDNISSPKVLENIPTVEVTDVVEIDSASLVSANNANTDCTNQLDNQVVIIPDDNQIVEPLIESSHSDLHVVNVAPVDESSQIAVENSISCSDNDNAPTVNEDIDSVEKSEIPVESNELEINSNHVISKNDTTDILDQEMNAKPHEEKLDNVSDLIENLSEVVECNGNVEENIDDGRTGECAIETTSGSGTVVDSEKDSIAEEQLPSAPQLAEAEAEAEAETPSATPPPPSPPSPMEPPQEPMPICDKMADLIPEIPAVPELQTETLQETSTDVTVAN